MPATDKQVQEFADQRLRTFAEKVRAVVIEATDIRAVITDVYEAVSAQDATWVDGRTDGPPHLLTRSDVLALNSLAETVKALAVDAQYPVALKACVRAPGV